MKKILVFGLLMISLALQANDIPLSKDEDPPINGGNDGRSSTTVPTASIDYPELTVFTGVVPAYIVIMDSNLSTVITESVNTNPLVVLDLALLPSGQYYLYIYMDGTYWYGSFDLD